MVLEKHRLVESRPVLWIDDMSMVWEKLETKNPAEAKSSIESEMRQLKLDTEILEAIRDKEKMMLRLYEDCK